MNEQNVIDYAFAFRKRVEMEMQKRGWKSKDLAKAVGVNPYGITNAFKQFGSKNKPYVTRMKIRKLFNITDL